MKKRIKTREQLETEHEMACENAWLKAAENDPEAQAEMEAEDEASYDHFNRYIAGDR